MKPNFTSLASIVPLAILAASIGVSAAACSSDDDSGTPATAGSDASTAGNGGDGGGGASTASGGGVIVGDGGVSLKTFSAPADPGPDGIVVSASGEALAITGFAFPPADPTNDTYMVDGWSFSLTAYITVFGSRDPLVQPGHRCPPTNRSMAPVVARTRMARGSPTCTRAECSPAKAATVSRRRRSWRSRSRTTGPGFDSTTTYGFGFSTVAAPADYNAFNVNLTADEADDYAYMVANGYSVLYIGTATFKGTICTQSTVATNTPSADGGAGYDFTKMPETVNFRLGFSTPTNYVNCQNGTDLSGPGVNGEDHPRGIQVKDNASIDAQVTIHMDHPFWESFAEDSPLHWDQIAGAIRRRVRYAGSAHRGPQRA